MKICTRNDVYIFVPSDLNLSPQISCQLLLFKVISAFLIRVNSRHGTDGRRDRQADGVQHLMRPPREAAHNKLENSFLSDTDSFQSWNRYELS